MCSRTSSGECLLLSDDRVEGRLWSMRALGHAVSISSLTQHLLTSLDNRERLKLLLKRVNKKPSRRTKKIVPFSYLGKLQSVYVSAQAKPYNLSLNLVNQEAWLKRCGLLEGCATATDWYVYSQRNNELNFQLPSSKYQAQWSGPCVDQETEFTVKKSSTPLELSSPPMFCLSEVSLLDSVTKEKLDLTQIKDTEIELSSQGNKADIVRKGDLLKVPEGSKIHLKLSGYEHQQIDIASLVKKLRLP